jgi:hypothetical protein
MHFISYSCIDTSNWQLLHMYIVLLSHVSCMYSSPLAFDFLASQYFVFAWQMTADDQWFESWFTAGVPECETGSAFHWILGTSGLLAQVNIMLSQDSVNYWSPLWRMHQNYHWFSVFTWSCSPCQCNTIKPWAFESSQLLEAPHSMLCRTPLTQFAPSCTRPSTMTASSYALYATLPLRS